MNLRTTILLFTLGTLTSALDCQSKVSAQDSKVSKSSTLSTASSPEPGQQLEMQFTSSDGAKVGYLLYLPENYEEQEHLPVMLFLHGRGESYGPLSLVAKWGPPRLAKRGDDLPYIIVSPQCPREDQWASQTQQRRVTELLDSILETFKTDQDRIYLTGLSMGGYGSWRMAADQPDRFAAVVPICGGATTDDAETLKGIPIWVWHGDQDRAVPIKKSIEIVDAIRAAGGESIRFTTLEGVGHNSWSAAYATADVYRWMNQQTRASSR